MSLIKLVSHKAEILDSVAQVGDKYVEYLYFTYIVRTTLTLFFVGLLLYGVWRFRKFITKEERGIKP